MFRNFDRSDKTLAWALVLVGVCFAFMAASGTPLVFVSRGGTPQKIPLLWAMLFVLPSSVVPFLLRNLGGLLLVLNAGVIAGSTGMGMLRANARGLELAVSWSQTSLSMIVVIAAVVGLSRMNVDWSDVGIDDLLS